MGRWRTRASLRVQSQALLCLAAHCGTGRGTACLHGPLEHPHPPPPPHSPSGSVRHSCVTWTCASYHFHFSSPCFLAHSDPKGPSHSATCGSYASLKQWVAACLGMPLSLGKAGSIPVTPGLLRTYWELFFSLLLTLRSLLPSPSSFSEPSDSLPWRWKMQSFLLKLAFWRVSPSMATTLTFYILQGFILYTAFRYSIS